MRENIHTIRVNQKNGKLNPKIENIILGGGDVKASKH
jgi:hypothetical protein